MQLFAETMQNVTSWLTVNPHWALLITFLISFSESIAVIGTIVPGSVTMTAIGILAGSGVMRIDLTLLAAILGAIGGDSTSYFIGYWYRDRLPRIWPFSRYPQLLRYGQSYFQQHGGKSVLIGRFAGPLRAVIPLIAGMMHMRQRNFLIANVCSAIGWSFLYLMPGVLIGAASSDLSAEVATRLFLYILIAILIAWLTGMGIRWLIIRLNYWLEKNLHIFWRFSARHPVLNGFVKFITPPHERNHYSTVFILITLLFCFAGVLSLSLLVYQGGWLIDLNKSLQYFFQSLRTVHFDWFFSIISMFYSPVTLILVATGVSLASIFLRQYRLLMYWVVLILSTFIITAVLNNLIPSPHPAGIDFLDSVSSFPSILLSLMTALMLFSMLLGLRNARGLLAASAYAYSNAFLILFCCLSSLYFSNHWFSDVLASLLLGIFTAVGTYLFYRRRPVRAYSGMALMVLILLWLGSALISNLILVRSYIEDHKLNYPQYQLQTGKWWHQSVKDLPRFRRNRLGKPVDLFNIQIRGSLFQFKILAEKAGWQPINKSFWQTLLERLSQTGNGSALPLFNQLYLNKKASLTMIKQIDHHKFVLQVWQSNYYIQSPNLPIYFASLYPVSIGKNHKLGKTRQERQYQACTTIIDKTLAAVQSCFLHKELQLPTPQMDKRKPGVPLKVYLIRENNLCF